jgi:uncharacterized membrane protein (UPF0127 family)
MEREKKRQQILAVFFTSLVLAIANPAEAQVSKQKEFKFETRKIQLAGHMLTVEIADSDEKRERGLMNRTSLANDHGMLFIFDSEIILRFWMKNTLIPLSIGYFDQKKILLETHEMKPLVLGEREPTTYPSHSPALYALEMPRQWFLHNRIKAGSSFTFVGKR